MYSFLEIMGEIESVRCMKAISLINKFKKKTGASTIFFNAELLFTLSLKGIFYYS